MKRATATTFLATASLLAGGLGSGTVLAANCTITSTGEHSFNSCETNDDKTVKIVCTNSADIKNINKQVATSGNVKVSDNTTISGTQTGNASNANDFQTALTLGCGPAKVAAAAQVPPAGGAGGAGAAAPQQAPSAGAGAGAGGAGAAAVAAQVPQVLPRTGTDNIIKNAAIASTLAMAFTGLSQVALAAYRQKT